MTSFAEKFKLKRKEKGLSQKALAQGICEQSQISKIEGGNYMPAADLLYRLARRLEVPSDYFFNQDSEIPSNLKSFKTLASKLLNDRNYQDLAYLFDLEKDKNQFLSQDDQAYLNCIGAILDFHLKNLPEKAIQALEKERDKLPSQSQTLLKILNTLANFYSLTQNDDAYERVYQELRQAYQDRELNRQEDLFGYLKIRYNYVHHLLSKNKKLEAIEEALETIEICKAHETSHQLPHLLVLLANASADFLDKKTLKTYYLDAKELFKIYDHKLLAMKIEKFLVDFEREIEKEQTKKP